MERTLPVSDPKISKKNLNKPAQAIPRRAIRPRRFGPGEGDLDAGEKPEDAGGRLVQPHAREDRHDEYTNRDHRTQPTGSRGGVIAVITSGDAGDRQRRAALDKEGSTSSRLPRGSGIVLAVGWAVVLRAHSITINATQNVSSVGNASARLTVRPRARRDARSPMSQDRQSAARSRADLARWAASLLHLWVAAREDGFHLVDWQHDDECPLNPGSRPSPQPSTPCRCQPDATLVLHVGTAAERRVAIVRDGIALPCGNVSVRSGGSIDG